jgi:hypothetical protein
MKLIETIVMKDREIDDIGNSSEPIEKNEEFFIIDELLQEINDIENSREPSESRAISDCKNNEKNQSECNKVVYKEAQNFITIYACDLLIFFKIIF